MPDGIGKLCGSWFPFGERFCCLCSYSHGELDEKLGQVLVEEEQSGAFLEIVDVNPSVKLSIIGIVGGLIVGGIRITNYLENQSSGYLGGMIGGFGVVCVSVANWIRSYCCSSSLLDYTIDGSIQEAV